MLNITDFLIEEGEKLAKRPVFVKIPWAYQYLEEEVCPKCNAGLVYGDERLSDIGTLAGDYQCGNCGYEWSVI